MLVPLSFYMATRLLSMDKVKLPPHYIVDRVDSQATDEGMRYDSVFHQMAELRLTNQLGKAIAINEDLQGKILVINFFFTDCPTVCPRLTGNVTLLTKAFRRTQMKMNDTLVQFISITVNPERDSFPVLRSYADRFHVNHDRWWFLTGDKKTIYDYARNELGLSTGPGDGGAEDFMHTEKLVLLDKERYIRGYYDGLDTAELRRCANDIGWLVLEKKRKRSR